LCPSRSQRLRVTHQPVKAVEAILLLLFGFPTQLRSPVPEFRRQHRFPYPQLRFQLSCRRWMVHPPISSQDSLSPLRSCQGPFAPQALPRFIATTSLSDSPASNPQLIVLLHVLLRRRNQRQGSPSLPNPTFPARCPLSPRRAPLLHSNVSSHRMAGFNSSGSLAALIWFNEAVSGSLALRLTGLFDGASTR